MVSGSITYLQFLSRDYNFLFCCQIYIKIYFYRITEYKIATYIRIALRMLQININAACNTLCDAKMLLKLYCIETIAHIYI